MFKYRIRSVTSYESGEKLEYHYPEFCQGFKFLWWIIPVTDWQNTSPFLEELKYADFNWAKWDLKRFIEETERKYKEEKEARKKKDIIKYTCIKGDI